jgi:hypothetical protein
MKVPDVVYLEWAEYTHFNTAVALLFWSVVIEVARSCPPGVAHNSLRARCGSIFLRCDKGMKIWMMQLHGGGFTLTIEIANTESALFRTKYFHI